LFEEKLVERREIMEQRLNYSEVASGVITALFGLGKNFAQHREATNPRRRTQRKHCRKNSGA